MNSDPFAGLLKRGDCLLIMEASTLLLLLTGKATLLGVEFWLIVAGLYVWEWARFLDGKYITANFRDND